MYATTKAQWRHAIVWLFWFLALLVLAWAHALPGHEMDSGVSVQLALPGSRLGSRAGQEVASSIVAGVVTHDPGQGPLFTWYPRRRWRKLALIHYQAARRAYRRAV
jgi:hypothetical protein